MRKILLAVLLLLVAQRSEAAFTFVAGGGNGNSATGTTLTFTIAGVHVGDLVGIGVKWEGGDTTVACSDTGSTFVDAKVGAHATDASGGSHTACYTLSSATSGTVTYTVTWGLTRTFRDIGGQAWTPTSAVVLDGTSALATGSSTACSSGNTTTTGTDGLGFGWYGETGGVPTTAGAAINGVTRDQITSYGSSSNSALWSKTYAAGFTGPATITITSNSWACGIMTFKSSAATTVTPRMTLFGVGP